MQKIVVRSADGKARELAFIREDRDVVYACSISKFHDNIKLDEIEVGFPIRDVLERYPSSENN